MDQPQRLDTMPDGGQFALDFGMPGAAGLKPDQARDHLEVIFDPVLQFVQQSHDVVGGQLDEHVRDLRMQFVAESRLDFLHRRDGRGQPDAVRGTLICVAYERTCGDRFEASTGHWGEIWRTSV